MAASQRSSAETLLKRDFERIKQNLRPGLEVKIPVLLVAPSETSHLPNSKPQAVKYLLKGNYWNNLSILN